MSNCNCEISMVRTMGINHCAKTGVSTTVKTATAELRHLSLTTTHNNKLVRELHLSKKELDHGELPLRRNRNVRTIRHAALETEVTLLTPRTSPRIQYLPIACASVGNVT